MKPPTAKMHKQLKIGQKRQKNLKNIENCLGMIFMAKYQKKNLFDKNKLFWLKSSQNASIAWFACLKTTNTVK